MELSDLYKLHNKPKQLLGFDKWFKKEFWKQSGERDSKMEEYGEIDDREIKKLIKMLDGRDKDFEEYILDDGSAEDGGFNGELILMYAGWAIKGRWKEAESHLINDPYNARKYAMFFNFRFKEAEAKIAQYAEPSYYYTVDVLEKPWRDVGLPEYEEKFKDNDAWWYDYCEAHGLDPEDRL